MQRSILQERNYLTYLSGSLFSTQGLWIQRMTLGWMMWQQTHSETLLGLLAFLMFFPTILFGPLFGVMVDRIDRRKAALVTSFILGLLSLLLALLVWQQFTNATIILVFSLAIGIANSAYQSIRLSFVPELVSKINMPKAVAINAILYNTSRFIGPVIAGYLIKYHSSAIALAGVALCYIPLITALLLLKLTPLSTSGKHKKLTFFSDIKAGLQAVLESSLISHLFLLMAVSAVLGRGLLEILPAAADILYQQSVTGLAWLNSAAGIGAIIAGLLLSTFKSARLLTALRIATLASGALLVLFISSRDFQFGLFIVAALSFCATVCGIATQSLIQVRVCSTFRGRVMSLWGAINVGGGALGGLMFGVLTEYMGYSATFIAMGSLCLFIALIVNPRIKRLALRSSDNA